VRQLNDHVAPRAATATADDFVRAVLREPQVGLSGGETTRTRPQLAKELVLRFERIRRRRGPGLRDRGHAAATAVTSSAT
jgi:hypothetical protein